MVNMFWVKTSLESEARSKQINKKCGFSCYAGVRVTLARIYPTTGGLVIYRWMLYTGTPHHGCKPHPPTGGGGDKQTYMYLSIYIYIHACMHACMHAYIHSYIHTDRPNLQTHNPPPTSQGGRGDWSYMGGSCVLAHLTTHRGGGRGDHHSSWTGEPVPIGGGGARQGGIIYPPKP